MNTYLFFKWSLRWLEWINLERPNSFTEVSLVTPTLYLRRIGKDLKGVIIAKLRGESSGQNLHPTAMIGNYWFSHQYEPTKYQLRWVIMSTLYIYTIYINIYIHMYIPYRYTIPFMYLPLYPPTPSRFFRMKSFFLTDRGWWAMNMDIVGLRSNAWRRKKNGRPNNRSHEKTATLVG